MTLRSMSNPASMWKLLLTLAAYPVVMIVLLGAFGSGVGAVELSIWFGVLVVGFLLILRGYRNVRG